MRAGAGLQRPFGGLAGQGSRWRRRDKLLPLLSLIPSFSLEPCAICRPVAMP